MKVKEMVVYETRDECCSWMADIIASGLVYIQPIDINDGSAIEQRYSLHIDKPIAKNSTEVVRINFCPFCGTTVEVFNG